MTEGTKFLATLLLLCNVVILTIGSPVFMPQFLPGGAGRHIRHLPCVSRKSGEQGVCMFAITCAKANGTHLGTCIDRFYFGSCCKMNKEPEIFPDDNRIDEYGPNNPFITNHESIDSNNIQEYSPKPSHTPTRIIEAPVKTTPTSIITEKPIKIADKLPVATTHAPISEPVKFTPRPTMKYTPKPVPESTTESLGLSTFQTVENSPARRPTTKYPQKITTVAPATTHSKPRPSSNRPTSSVKPNQKPSTSNSTKIGTNTTARPSVYKPQNGGSTPTETTTTTVKPILTTTQRSTVSATRFPPRNATTTTTTTRPTRPTPVRRPTSTTTKRPASTPPKRVTTTSTTPKTPVTKRPTTVLGIKNVTATLPSTVSIPVGGQKPTTPGKRPSVAVQSRPTAATTISLNRRPTTPSSKPASSSVSNKPTATSPKPPSTRPRPKPTTQIPEFPTTKVPLQKPAPTIVATTSTTTTTTTTTTTKRPIASSSRPRPTLSTVAPLDTASISNDVISLEDTTNEVPSLNTNKVETTTYSPGLVTWTSNSDDATTRSPVIPTVVTEPEEPTNTEWTPITTPDGWILIHSPAPSDPPEIEDKPTAKPTPKPITSSPVTDNPVTVPTSTTKRSPTRPSLPTVATTPSTTDNYIPTVELNTSDYKQVCGRRFFPESRIVGGAKSTFGKWPWQISLRQWRTSTYLHKCGAALLNENWAITAAHCVENVAPSDLLLRLGEHDLESEDEPYGFQERRVQIVASHPQFDPRTFEYDLALLRFYEPLLPFQPNTVPICLPDDDANYVGLMAHVTGWGRLYEDGPLPSVMQEVSVPVINNTVCEAMYRSAGYIEHIPNIFICAGWRKGGFDSCEGDSGGPLVIQRPRDRRWILAGVISWGIGCAEPNQPGVYTRISEFREWINQILQF
ncbi:serine proteinase stubble isoform X2 [Diprion similis]|uniref:serine proteinase stubble isoform X2 n=1 Tax=Diprion similis TaxID=362088 RepID=UPI001EF7C95E|nr:serine proteinase stubble isoform X2 [Diprion similis]